MLGLQLEIYVINSYKFLTMALFVLFIYVDPYRQSLLPNCISVWNGLGKTLQRPTL